VCLQLNYNYREDIGVANWAIRSESNYCWRSRATRLCSSIYQRRLAPMRLRKVKVVRRTDNT
jgi:hypothetical protein